MLGVSLRGILQSELRPRGREERLVLLSLFLPSSTLPFRSRTLASTRRHRRHLPFAAHLNPTRPTPIRCETYVVNARLL
eukprot:scaffold670_cov333-Pavlova_lutheri.AAC.8